MIKKLIIIIISTLLAMMLWGMATATTTTSPSTKLASADNSADLIITQLDVPKKGIKGCSLIATSTIKNQGTSTSPGFWVNYYLKTKSNPKKVYIGHNYSKNLYPGEITRTSSKLSLPLTLTSGNYYLYAQADAAGKVVENNEKNNYQYSTSTIKIVGPQLSLLNAKIGGNVLKNSEINQYIPHTEYTMNIYRWLKRGSIVLKYGDGSGSPLLISAGIHGNETEANISIMRYVEYLKDKNIKGTLYIIPFALPYATSYNSRFYRGYDPNRRAHIPGTPGWHIIEFSKNRDIKYILDVHSGLGVPYNGLLNLNPSITATGFKWASYISRTSGCSYVFKSMEKGMLRTESGKYGMTHVTIEVDRTRISTLQAANTEWKIINAACQYWGFPMRN